MTSRKAHMQPIVGPRWPKLAFDYSGATVLVTGGTSGIGAGIAAAYREAGADVIITGTRARADQYEGDLSRFHYRQLALTDDAQIREVTASLPCLDVLVNNAGANFVAADEYRPETFDRSVQVNLLAAYHLAYACRPLLARSEWPGGASIVGLASMTSYFAVEVVPGYGAAKAGLVQLTKTLATAWAADGIRVNAVAAGFILTPMTRYLAGNDAAAAPVLARTP
ncbi:MAG TPA: SDR family oxidoreductase, partial [Steroidobacteraceae bacterium]|nr:SDR family oxidoreductase [Steroidobacteraceae bacterium]